VFCLSAAHFTSGISAAGCAVARCHGATSRLRRRLHRTATLETYWTDGDPERRRIGWNTIAVSVGGMALYFLMLTADRGRAVTSILSPA